MTAQERLHNLNRILFQPADTQLYGVLDGASIPNLLSLLAQHDVLNVCLFRGELDPELAEAAPYLVELPADASFTRLLLTKGLGHHWGILARTKADFRTLRMHFRKFLTVYDPDGKPLHFRYYDPRVLRVYLPTCNTEELRIVFGPVTTYFAEADTADVLARFSFNGETLGQQQLTLSRSQSAPTEA